jgi:hypothetical protein
LLLPPLLLLPLQPLLQLPPPPLPQPLPLMPVDRGSITIATAPTGTLAIATAELRALLGFVDPDLAPIEHGPVELRYCLRGGLLVCHGHEGEAAWLPGLPIGGDGHLPNLPYRGEGRLDGFLGAVERKISDE